MPSKKKDVCVLCDEPGDQVYPLGECEVLKDQHHETCCKDCCSVDWKQLL